MKVPLSWLKEYVPITLPIKELAHRLTMAGLEVGGVQTVGGAWEHCFVGRVLKVERHPNADRLTLCTVDIGSETIQVVCGAPNVAAAQMIPFAKVGARLFSPHTGKLEALKAAKIRGVISNGMICSERELGIGEDHAGIVVLPEDAPLGVPLTDYLGDTILELEPTTNRPDWFSLLGIAHEVAALTSQSVQQPALDYPEAGEPIQGLMAVEIWDAELCPRYTASLITGVKIGPSPRWMQDLLLRAGQRPINNVVDITNYVMLELGQPLHAFDYHLVGGRKIIVRAARPGEVLTTLDGQERKVEPPMLVIADADRAVALAGVMGGSNSEVTEGTTAILLESASFHPFNTRRTAAALRLRTEASARFEKGLRPELPVVGLRRATQLILKLAGGTAARGICDVYPGKKPESLLTLTTARLRKVLGVDVPMTEAQQVLTHLGLRCQPQGHDTLQVAVPYWRSDIAVEDDLVEEVVRIVGYDRMPTTMLSTSIPTLRPDPARELKERVRDLLAACGMQEVITYSLVSRDALALATKAGDANDVAALRVSNPISPQHEYLRTDLRTSLLTAFAANHRHEEGPLQLFEVARAYLPRERDLPEERETAAGVLGGPRTGAAWLRDEGALGFYDAKGVVEAVLGQLGVAATYEPLEDSFFQPGRAAQVKAGDAILGQLGEAHPRLLERFDIEAGPVALFELDLEALLKALPPVSRRYQPPQRLPGAVRDLAVVVDVSVPAAKVQELIARQRLVAQVILFDAYAGPQVPSGKCSLAFRITFHGGDRTLTAEEVQQELHSVLDSLAGEVGATPRG